MRALKASIRPGRFRTLLYIAVSFSVATPAFAETQTLEQTLAAVYQGNPELAAARAQLRATDEQVSQALSGWRPTLNGIADEGASRQSITGGTPPVSESLNPHDIGVQLTQPVFSGFKTTSGVTSAEAAIKAGRAGLQDTEQKVFLDAAKAYLDVVQAQTILDLDRDAENILKAKLAEVQDRLRIKELSKTDLSQAQSRLNEATVARLQAEGDLANQRVTFNRIVGQMPGLLAQPSPGFVLPQSKDAAIEAALQKNPAVVAASFSSIAAKADITTAEGNLLPEVDVVGSASHTADQSPFPPERSNSATVLVRLTVPFYTAGTDYSKTREAQQTSSQKRLELDDARNKTREQASNAWQSYMTAHDAEAGDLGVVAAEKEAYDGVVLEARYGTRTTLDVLNAEQEWLNARINLAKASHDRLYAKLQLKAAIGEFTAEALTLPVTKYDPAANYKAVRNKWVGFADAKNEALTDAKDANAAGTTSESPADLKNERYTNIKD